jgi:hypothetical protein
MTEITKEIVVYLSEDGKEFLSRYDCVKHEEKMKEVAERYAYLSEFITKEMNYFFKRDSTNLFKVTAYDDDLTIETLWDGHYSELDGDFDIDYSLWDPFKRMIRIKYGYDIKTPSWYWGK